MSLLGEILGQRRAVEVLTQAVAAGRAHHAYLFEGPAGIGKATTARALAAALNCEARDAGGCGRCGACAKIVGGMHPDVIAWDMTPKGLTERVRDLIALAGFRPHEGRARVVIFDPADALAGPQDRAEPANVLLKTLEEPPAGTHFVLVSAEPRRLPVTVLSRCQRVRFVPLTDETIARLLIERHGVEAKIATAAAELSGGSVGRALDEAQAMAAAGSTEGSETVLGRGRALAGKLLDATRGGSVLALFEHAGEVGMDRELVEAALTQMGAAIRDGLLAAEGGAGGRVPEARREAAARRFGAWSPGALVEASRLVDDAVVTLRGNVAPALVIEHLVLGMQRLGRLGAPARTDGRAA
jgi:DNA polymerase-3 subunit delta'